MARFNKINQNADSVTIPKRFLLSIIYRYELKKKECSLLLFLFTQLDSSNYTYLDEKRICQKLGFTNKEYRKAFNGLLDVGIIVEGSGESSDGYRFVLDRN